MKGIYGLIIAIGLGIVAAMFNWAYLAKKAQDTERVYFIGIKANEEIAVGEVITEEKLEPVAIPERWMGNLDEYCVLWEARSTIVGKAPWRLLKERSLLLDADVTPERRQMDLAAAMAAANTDTNKLSGVVWMGIPVDTRTTVPKMVKPGDMVSFLVSAPTAAFRSESTDGEFEGEMPPPAPAMGNTSKTLGPFRVVSVGNRYGRYEIFRAAKKSPTQENVLGIAAKIDKAGNLEAKYQTLENVLQATNFKPMRILLHPAPEE